MNIYFSVGGKSQALRVILASFTWCFYCCDLTTLQYDASTWQVQDNSPGCRAGLEPYFDFIISVCDTRLVRFWKPAASGSLNPPGLWRTVSDVFVSNRRGTTTPWKSCWKPTWSAPSRCCCTTARRKLCARRPSCPATRGAATGSWVSAFASAASKEPVTTFGTSWWVCTGVHYELDLFNVWLFNLRRGISCNI